MLKVIDKSVILKDSKGREFVGDKTTTYRDIAVGFGQLPRLQLLDEGTYKVDKIPSHDESN